MQLNQPIPPPYTGGDDQYDFILNGNQKAKKSRLPQGKSRKQRLFWVIGAGLGLVIILAIVFSMVLNSGGSPTKALFSIAQTQTEIVRVSGGSSLKARSLTTRNFAETVTVTMTSSQQQTVNYLTSHKTKVKPKELALGQDSKTDAALKSAEAAGRYDQELLAILEKSLAEYRTQVSEAFKATNSPSQKQLLEQLFNQVTTLLSNQPAISS
jgi:hypothetical protein